VFKAVESIAISFESCGASMGDCSELCASSWAGEALFTVLDAVILVSTEV